MNRQTRKTVIAGNWKMNMTPSQTSAFLAELAPKVAGKENCDIVVCVPFVDIPAAVEAAKGTNIKIGAQNIHHQASGAFTGEVSAAMLVECGVTHVVIGHSERRQYFGETDVTVNQRVRAAIASDLTAILCVGELLSEREEGITQEVVTMQTQVALMKVTSEDLKKVMIAYEPIWAIGTGKTATPEQADEVCGIIRNVLAEKYGKDVAERVTIQYGGSMNAKNAKELLSKTNIDGGLIGGASLKTEDFSVIIHAAQ